MPALELAPDGTSFVIDPITWRREGNNTEDGGFNKSFSNEATSVTRPVQLRKLLYSATLTKDPQKLASLGLVNAKHFDAHHLAINDKSNDGGNDSSYTSHLTSHQRYSVPDSLSEFKVECTAEQKPLVLLALLLELKQRESNNQEGENPTNGIVVVFTSSVDSTHRLARLLQLLWGAAGYGPTAAIAEFSSALNHKQRSRLLKKCNDRSSDSGENISVVVCSDGMSRGMDLPSVSAVINYDVPAYAKTYVHRCGRTARAGRKGIAISVLKGGQVGQFLKMRQLIDNPKRIQQMGVQKHLVSGAIPMYQACVQALRQVMDAENDGEIDNVSSLPSEWIPSANHKKNPVTSHESDSEADNASHSSSSVPSSDDESI
jgi:ATP-dependent RNA helicase DDX51/DBP6